MARSEAAQAAIANEVPDTAIKVYANNWVATIVVSPEPSPDGFFHIYASTVGTTKLHALEAAVYVLNAYAFGRTTFIRVKPEVMTQRSFQTKGMAHRGHVRFSYKLEPGTWSYPDPSTPKLLGEF